MVRTSGTSPVCPVHLVCFVYLVHLVYPVSLVQPNKQDKPNKPIKRDRPDRLHRPNEQDRLADFFSILLGQRRKRNQRYTALMSTDPNMTGNPNLKNCQNEMG
jgi:hypothetical protein